jgi:hypothetical protein
MTHPKITESNQLLDERVVQLDKQLDGVERATEALIVLASSGIATGVFFFFGFPPLIAGFLLGVILSSARLTR